jgi:hypothetical protein
MHHRTTTVPSLVNYKIIPKTKLFSRIGSPMHTDLIQCTRLPQPSAGPPLSRSGAPRQVAMRVFFSNLSPFDFNSLGDFSVT